MTSLRDLLPPDGGRADPDGLYDAFGAWAAEQGTPLYPHQDEAVLELFGGANVVLATPTGSGKSLVAEAAHLLAMARGDRTYYTAPIKALVSEKFFALCARFGADKVGMVTGDAAVNPEAPLMCCTAEILANIALREGQDADIGLVVMDEFHFYAEPDRGWAWQVPLIELPQAQFLLMSATLGDVTRFEDDLTRRTGRPTVVVAGTERPVPLTFTWSMSPLHETITELLETHRAPVYIVHFTQKDAVTRAQGLLSLKLVSRERRDAIAARLGAFRFTAGFGRLLSKLVRSGIGVHHAGMLPRYRRLVEQLAQDGLLEVICGTDTLGVGINVPIRTVVFTGLTKFDGNRQRLLRAREFHQIAGRAGRAGFDTSGGVVVQAPEFAIENARALAKAGDDPKRQRKVQRRKPPDGQVTWTEDTFTRLVNAEPEALVSRMRVDHSLILNLVARDGDAFAAMRHLLEDSHEDRRAQLRLARRALSLTRSMLGTGVLRRLEEPDATGRRYALSTDVQDDFALNQPLAPFALAVLDVLDPQSPHFALDVVSVIESVLEDPRPVLWAQQSKAKGEAVAEMKAEGLEYEERMEQLEDVTWPQPLAELLETTLGMFRRTHPWVRESALSPKSVVRDMYERAMSFTEFVSFYQLARSEGIVLRYLSDAYRALRQTVPETLRTDELDDLIHWLGETIRQTDSSLLDEWEALTDPDRVAAAEVAEARTERPRPITGNARAFRVMVRNSMFRRVELAAREDVGGLAALEESAAALTDPPRTSLMSLQDWADALAGYFGEHASIGIDADARGPDLLAISEAGGPQPGVPEPRPGSSRSGPRDVRLWHVRQTIDDPAGDHDYVIESICDLDASDDVGEPVVFATAFRRM